MKLFTDGSDLNGIENPLDIHYVKILRALLKSLFAWPSRAVGENEPKSEFFGRLYVNTLEFVCLVPQLLFIRHNAGKMSFFVMGHSYFTFLMNIVAVTRFSLLLTKKYHEIGGIFIRDFHLFNHRHRSDYAMETHLKVHKLCHAFTIYLVSLLFCGICLFNLLPLYNNFVAGNFEKEQRSSPNTTFEHAVFFAVPHYIEHTFNGYLILSSFNWYISYVCASIMFLIDLYLSLIVFHVWGHLNVVINSLNTFPKPKNTCDTNACWSDVPWYSDEENKEVFLRLREILIHHTSILKFIALMSDTFGFVIFVYYGFHQASGCLLLLECSQMDTTSLLRYGVVTFGMFQQLIQISVIFEMLNSMTEKLERAVFNVSWESMNTKNRRIVYLLLQQSQLPMNLKAFGMVNVGYQTMLTILKTSISYFIMLRSVTVGK